MKIEIGNKVKTKLEQPDIMCHLRERVEFYHWWVVISISDKIYKLQDKRGLIINIDVDGYDIENDNKYVIYKVK